ncbi:MAG: FAD/NAD(P)-binding oxidoreductase, partial [Campylobacterota bacterium]|nr:FAD/NAD(P)-binding oxidoreductase [Campylobacterota bacterium]
MKRRDALKVLGIGAGASVLGTGCMAASTAAAVPSTTANLKETIYKDRNGKKRLVIIGGGISGMALASMVNGEAGKDIEVIVLEQNRAFHSCPGSNVLLAKSAKEYANELGAPVGWIFNYNMKQKEFNIITNCKVLSGNPKTKVLETTEGNIAYDALVLATGIEYATKKQFPTWDDYKLRRLQHEAPAAMQQDAGEEWMNMSARWEGLIRQAKQNPHKQFTLLLNSTPKTTTTGEKALRRCPPAAGERASTMAARVKKEGLKNLKINFMIELDGSLGSKGAAFKQSWEALGYCKDILKPTKDDIVHPIFNARVKDIDFDKKVVTYTQNTMDEDGMEVVSTATKDIAYDEAVIMVWQSVPAVVANIFGDASVKLKADSFECEKFPGHYVLGDSQSTHQLPASGSMGMSIAGILSGEIISGLKGNFKQGDYTEASNTCFSMVGEKPNEGIKVSHTF